jgi:hypothetical protein
MLYEEEEEIRKAMDVLIQPIKDFNIEDIPKAVGQIAPMISKMLTAISEVLEQPEIQKAISDNLQDIVQATQENIPEFVESINKYMNTCYNVADNVVDAAQKRPFWSFITLKNKFKIYRAYYKLIGR